LWHENINPPARLIHHEYVTDQASEGFAAACFVSPPQ
jgi:hypothetical protein